MERILCDVTSAQRRFRASDLAPALSQGLQCGALAWLAPAWQPLTAFLRGVAGHPGVRPTPIGLHLEAPVEFPVAAQIEATATLHYIHGVVANGNRGVVATYHCNSLCQPELGFPVSVTTDVLFPGVSLPAVAEWEDLSCQSPDEKDFGVNASVSTEAVRAWAKFVGDSDTQHVPLPLLAATVGRHVVARRKLGEVGRVTSMTIGLTDWTAAHTETELAIAVGKPQTKGGRLFEITANTGPSCGRVIARGAILMV